MRGFLCTSVIGFVLIGSPGVAVAQTPPGTTKIQEDWEAIVSDPSTDEAGPQITTTMSPTGNNAQLFAAFNLNYRDSPFRAGGYQIQGWLDGQSLGSWTSWKSGQFNTPGERITWTQTMELRTGYVSFEIDNGQSTTWGSFGRGDYQEVWIPTSLKNFNSYSSSYSLANSGVTWQANRMQRMRLLAVRYYNGSTLISQETTPRDVNLEPSQ